MRVVGFGAGGHAKVLIDALRLRGVDVVALTDPDTKLHGTRVNGVEVAGDDSMWSAFLADGIRHAFVAVGSVGDATRRRNLFEQACAAGFEMITVVHPAAVVARSAVLGRGVQILAGAIVNASATIGDNVIVNSGAIVEHDCVVEAHAHIATGARLASTVTVGEGAHVGIGASVRQCIHIANGAVVGAGAAVIRDVAAGETVIGVPATTLVRRIGVR